MCQYTFQFPKTELKNDFIKKAKFTGTTGLCQHKTWIGIPILTIGRLGRSLIFSMGINSW